MALIPKRYIGDGVYVEHDGDHGCLVLTTENGICATNTIYLEPEHLEELIRFYQDLKAAAADRT